MNSTPEIRRGGGRKKDQRHERGVIDNILKVVERFALIGVGIKRGNNKKKKNNIYRESERGRKSREGNEKNRGRNHVPYIIQLAYQEITTYLGTSRGSEPKISQEVSQFAEKPFTLIKTAVSTRIVFALIYPLGTKSHSYLQLEETGQTLSS